VAFGKKPRPPAATWTCGCRTVLSARILFCNRCGVGQGKEKK
jgi:hypothetical protein